MARSQRPRAARTCAAAPGPAVLRLPACTCRAAPARRTELSVITSMTGHRRFVVIGAGAGGLAAAALLGRAGHDVQLIERASAPGGKMRQVNAAGAAIDAGPTVFTLRWVFDALFEACGAELAQSVPLQRAEILARHAWMDGSTLSLYADITESEAAIAEFAGPSEAAGFRAFMDEARSVYTTLRQPFISAQKPSVIGLTLSVGDLTALWRIRPFETYSARLAKHFRDSRLIQLFGRYATYVGASPYLAPATLMLIAHVEQDGVWLVAGGMQRLARALGQLAEQQGVRLRLGVGVAEILVSHGRANAVRLEDGEILSADGIVFCGDASALGSGLLGEPARRAAPALAPRQRSLSAVTWCGRVRTSGFDLSYHNVFFGEDYPAEFDHIFRQRAICGSPTVYVCAQDRLPGAQIDGPERLLVLVNAPPDGDGADLARSNPARIAPRVEAVLARGGLRLEPGLDSFVATAPDGFNALFPGSGGALYGAASHGPFASFARPGARTRLPGLYLAGGSAHPGAGVPMATLSGMLAAGAISEDLARSARRKGR